MHDVRCMSRCPILPSLNLLFRPWRKWKWRMCVTESKLSWILWLQEEYEELGEESRELKKDCLQTDHTNCSSSPSRSTTLFLKIVSLFSKILLNFPPVTRVSIFSWSWCHRFRWKYYIWSSGPRWGCRCRCTYVEFKELWGCFRSWTKSPIKPLQ